MAGAAASSGRGGSAAQGGKAASGSGGATVGAGGHGGSNTGTAGKTASGGAGGTAAGGGGGKAAGSGGAGGTGEGSSSGAGMGETGRLVGMTDAHNAVRARIMSPAPNPALPALKWSADVAKIAQAYADKLAKETMCQSLEHSGAKGYGENLAAFGGLMATPKDVVEGWAAEEECLTFGPITDSGSECNASCAEKKFSNGCGHYTQVVWRATTELGCGVASCGSGRQASEVWVCNYRPQGNIIGQKPY